MLLKQTWRTSPIAILTPLATNLLGPVVSSAFSSLCYDGLIATHMLAHAYRYVGLSDGEDTDTEEDGTEEDGTEEDGTEEDGTEKYGTEQDGTDQDHEMDGVVTLSTAEQPEDFEMHENLEHGYEGT
ncbi:hypothetical protein F2Q68_00038993 [Brassica cretica]|uniref:Uncharacterized protein n=1 Tax=Brassica cretica TaxID=69181 RepID=A0A8S9MTQ0_BRACR|nr:hypothetical protein F2Q68_00038993 [Brassica cretica]